jgi:hypothetical protein
MAQPTDFADLGSSLARAGRYEEAERMLRRAVADKPDDAFARFNLGLLLLLLGNFDQGWPLYESRFEAGNRRPPSSKTRPTWDGSPLDGRTIVVLSEQGFGDTIHFVRYAKPLKEQKGAGRVVLMCEKELVALMRTAAGVDEVIERVQGNRPAHFDTLCALGSLPHRFRSTPDSFPRHTPYLAADPSRAARWRESLGLSRQTCNVGLVWAGNANHLNDAYRSCRLTDLAPLASVAGVRFVSLQFGAAREQLANAPAGLNVTDATSGIADFADSAALLAELDLLITVDSAPAHLAGALARPVWTLLPRFGDFRWQREGSATPWYPTMRLFRQTRQGEWGDVVFDVTAALRDLASQTRPT